MAGYPIMSKIRINELARELEVKPNVILDLLRDLGVQDKKTHSSSLEDDQVLMVRRRLGGEAAVEEAARRESSAVAVMDYESLVADAEDREPEATPPVVPAPIPEAPVEARIETAAPVAQLPAAARLLWARLQRLAEQTPAAASP